jgi:DNA helicase-2/ATP-dependent DNA helicase PcrA
LISLKKLFDAASFKPNEAQLAAIEHVDGPLFLIAGPGSGKTRVLLWRTVNLIVCHGISPDEIFLGTFTEKAAQQLKEGLRTLLGMATNLTDQSYDISKMYVGTVHSSCQKLISDRRFSVGRNRRKTPTLMDQLDQYFFVKSARFWSDAKEELSLPDDIFELINDYFETKNLQYRSQSPHSATQSCIALFNRWSEEVISPDVALAKAEDDTLKILAQIYGYYLRRLNAGKREQVDFSLLQQSAAAAIEAMADGGVFKHVIVDEYQDTNTIQERIFFSLAKNSKNICVVGDDDQALYRFRGATVENFVEFPERCKKYLVQEPRSIRLNTNYRSRKEIVDFYTRFIAQENWDKNPQKKQYYRLADKDIKAHSTDKMPSVIASNKQSSLLVAEEISVFVKNIIDKKKVADPNQIAFLYPSLQSEHARRMKTALEEQGLLVYAPRAGRFLEGDEPTAMFGLFLKVIGKPDRGEFPGVDYNDFHNWLGECDATAGQLMKQDPLLKSYVAQKQKEIELLKQDYNSLLAGLKKLKLDLKTPYDPDKHKRAIWGIANISEKAKGSLGSSALDKIAKQRIEEGNPFQINYVINRATSPDWSVLDLFYRFAGFGHFKAMFDLAETGEDEGPICNLGLISEYLGRFIDKNGSVITGSFLYDNRFQNAFVMGYLFALFRLGEGEYEDADDPFPKGRIPFLTVHQSKGLEFPVVVLGNPRKDDRGAQKVEQIVRPMLDKEGEPLERIGGFDIMRMFYVALSRAKNLLIVAHPSGQGIRIHPHIKTLLENDITRIDKFDMKTLPSAEIEVSEIPKTYSFTADYMLFERCARQYMIFRKYGFVASRTQTMFFGSLVHQTIEDLHNRLIAIKGDLP